MYTTEAISGRILSHEGELSHVVRDSGLGVVANPDDPLDIAKKLVQMRREIRANRFPSAAKAELLARFNRRNLAKRLADLFCEVQLPAKA